MDEGLARSVGTWSLIAWLLVTAGLALADRSAAAGVACGGAASLGLFSLHRLLMPAWRHAQGRRKARRWLWAIWVVKWPLVGALLYLSLSVARAAPGWVCAGAGLVPAVATAMALRAAVWGQFRLRADTEGG